MSLVGRLARPPSMRDPETVLEGLNPSQRAAVVHEGGPLLIVAGAGSGKTRVLTRRIAYLLAARDVHPGAILAITFTNKAAGEMRERVTEMVGNRARAMWVSTFHSACVRILRSEIKRFGMSSSFSIYDQADSQRLMALVLRGHGPRPEAVRRRARSSAQVSNLKNELIDHETYRVAAQNDMELRLAEAYGIYQQRLQQANALDFDDLIMTTVNLLQAFPDAAEHYRRRFRHVMVDEYQDTNHAQYVLVRELVGGSVGSGRGADGRRRPRPGRDRRHGVPPAELVVVGDADQSIYAFRGATIRNILQFEQDYPDAKTILLEQNYRSTQTILNAANSVISRNSERKPKRLWTDAGAGHMIIGYVAENEHDEAAFVAEEIDKLTDAGGGEARRGRGVLPDERAEPGVRGGLHPGRPAVQGGRRRAVLRAARDPRRARLPAGAGQPRGHRVAAAHPQHPEAGDRRPGRGVHRGARRPRADLVRPGAASGPRRRTASRPGRWRRSQGFNDAHGRAARPGRERRDAGRRARGDADPVGLPRRARRVDRPAGREPGREPAGARRGGARVRRRRPRRRADRVPRAGRAGRRRRPDPGRARRRRRRRAGPRRAWSR